MPLQAVASAVRVRKGNYLGVVVLPFVVTTVYGHFDLAYDDGSADSIDTNQATTVAGTAILLRGSARALKDGWITACWVNGGSGAARNGWFAQFFITPDEAFSLPNVIPIATQEANVNLAIPGQLPPQEGPVWAFQGTVAEDATAGTHVCTLTVTPGAGSELELLYGQVQVGSTATAQTADMDITDGTNVLAFLMNGTAISGTTSGLRYPWPQTGQQTTATLAADLDFVPFSARLVLSGTMQVILRVTTVAVSVTQTFSIVGRIRGTALPTATLADTVGAPVLTTNTNGVF